MGDPSGPGMVVRIPLVDSATMPGFATRAIKAASRVPDVPQAPVNVPIYATSTFEVSDATELAELLEFTRPGHSYSRYSNPTHDALELALAELEGAEAGLVTASGMAAIFAVMLSILRAGTRSSFRTRSTAARSGWRGRSSNAPEFGHRIVDPTDAGAVEAAIDGGANSGSVEDRADEADHAAVDRARNDELIARAQQREHDTMDRRHARCRHQGCLGALQLGERRLERGVRRIRVPTVGVTRTLELEELGELDGIGDLEGARLIDRHVDRRLRRLGSTAGGTNGTRGEARHGW